MCILLLSTNSEHYHSVILSNRDELLGRSTAPAAFWHNDSILSSLDLARPERGSWLGISRSGKVAVLTNYKEPSSVLFPPAPTSRGRLVTDFLVSKDEPEEWVQNTINANLNTGGFNMLCGQLSNDTSKQKLACFSNRSSSVVCCTTSSHLASSCPNSPPSLSFGLSNSLSSEPWPKVHSGTRLLDEIISTSSKEDWTQEKFLQECFSILSHDTLPLPPSFENLRHSIFIPLISTPVLPNPDSTSTPEIQYYATRTQTVVLVDYKGNVTFVERNLYRKDGSLVPVEERDRKFTFSIHDW